MLKRLSNSRTAIRVKTLVQSCDHLILDLSKTNTCSGGLMRQQGSTESWWPRLNRRISSAHTREDLLQSQQSRKRVSMRKGQHSLYLCNLAARRKKLKSEIKSSDLYLSLHRASASQLWATRLPCPRCILMSNAPIALLYRVRTQIMVPQSPSKTNMLTILPILTVSRCESSLRHPHNTTLTTSRRVERSSLSQATCSMCACQQHGLRVSKAASSLTRAQWGTKCMMPKHLTTILEILQLLREPVSRLNLSRIKWMNNAGISSQMLRHLKDHRNTQLLCDMALPSRKAWNGAMMWAQTKAQSVSQGINLRITMSDPAWMTRSLSVIVKILKNIVRKENRPWAAPSTHKMFNQNWQNLATSHTILSSRKELPR